MEEITAPGLKWIKRRASKTPVWVASAKDYEPRTVNLSHLRDEPEQLLAKCALLQAELNAWKAGLRERDLSFDGTLKSLLLKYHTEEDSPYFALRPGSQYPYDYYLNRLVYEIGDRHIDKITGVDLKRWHDAWSEGGEKLAASKMMRAVLDAAVSYGIMCRITPCLELRETLKAASRKLPRPRRRESIITADQVIALRANAHADGRPSCALAYALVFETTLRLWDVIGQWVPLNAKGISTVVSERMQKKWFGLKWEDIDEDLVLRYVPSKTSMKTGLAVTFPLSRAPMVMEELEHWPAESRVGPVILFAGTGEPYSGNWFEAKWRIDRKAAGLSSKIWARDLRASGITEGRAAGISTDDAAKVAGHASTKTTSDVYDRAALEAAERFADARSNKRKTSS
ncbi:Phage integrase family protein [Rhizobium sp. NFR07]|uniref:site-specific integrase n=1 Tax=Rhizobium sp. NFR07 TaxID=1566262 RepID=UPI0008E8EFCA|nr:site-specific integrase [Rhizobium sp. NFR07]SFB52701.1 Phage integrase family protein [Rhizobium sp. NFR07]